MRAFSSSERWVWGQKDMASVKRSCHIIITFILHPLFAITCFFPFPKGSSKRLCSQKPWKKRCCWYRSFTTFHFNWPIFTNLQRPTTQTPNTQPLLPPSPGKIRLPRDVINFFNSLPFNKPTTLLSFRRKLYPCHLLHHLGSVIINL